MLTLMQHTTNGLPHPFSTLEALLAEPFPRTPQDRMQLEQQLSTAAAQTADHILLVQVTRAHEDEAFVRPAIAPSRAQRAVPLVHKGLRTKVHLYLGLHYRATTALGNGWRVFVSPLLAPGGLLGDGQEGRGNVPTERVEGVAHGGDCGLILVASCCRGDA